MFFLLLSTTERKAKKPGTRTEQTPQPKRLFLGSKAPETVADNEGGIE